jgi:hypothetical protein
LKGSPNAYRLVVHLASSFPLAKVLRQALENLRSWQAMPLTPPAILTGKETPVPGS